MHVCSSALAWPGEGLSFKLDLNIHGGGMQNVGTIRVTPWPLFMSGLGPLAKYGTGVNYYHM